MVAYSFQRQFIGPIRVGLGIRHLNERGMQVIPGPRPKRQTIREWGKRRHARPTERLQLYHAMRTKQCFKIADAICAEVVPIWIRTDDMTISVNHVRLTSGAADIFATDDGFKDLAEMQAFWHAQHPGVVDFDGCLIRWKPMEPQT